MRFGGGGRPSCLTPTGCEAKYLNDNSCLSPLQSQLRMRDFLSNKGDSSCNGLDQQCVHEIMFIDCH